MVDARDSRNGEGEGEGGIPPRRKLVRRALAEQFGSSIVVGGSLGKVLVIYRWRIAETVLQKQGNMTTADVQISGIKKEFNAHSRMPLNHE
ncbi:hypothetical protein P40081_06220 [Paenibacillus sp. FSL P4-0081]|nr:hypothetical protein P40081_06220 [Paenibacillus sp. FSL P4-0081]